MRISAVAMLMILTTVFLSGCAQDQSASVDDRSSTYYGRLRTVTPTGARNALFTPTPHDASMQADAAVPDVSARELGAPEFKKKLSSQAAATPVRVVAKNAATPAPQPRFINTKAIVPAPAQLATSGWQWPVEGKVTQRFGKQGNGIANEGITIAAAEGAPIHAAQAGEVAFIGNNVRDYGNIVILRHSNGDMTSYAHASDIIVKKGDRVNAGAVVGYVGQSGRAKTPQLHFAMRSGDRAIDPVSKLPSQMAAN